MSRRNTVYRGLNCRVARTGFRQRLSGSAGQSWQHPWEIDCTFVMRPAAERGGENAPIGDWRATVNPGFVNGRPAYIEMPAEWIRELVATGVSGARDFGINPLTGKPYFSEWVFNNRTPPTRDVVAGGPGGPVRLTHSPAPYIVLGGWRNPVAASGLSASDEGDIIYGKGEGYPEFFESIGVRPPAPGGKTSAAPFDPLRTRQIRALDIVLTQPRPGSSLTIQELNFVTDNFTHQIDTTFTTAYYTAQAGRAKLAAVSKYVPLEQQWIDSPFLGLPMNAGDPQIDQLKMATIWMVSPPGTPEDAQPDHTWEPYVEHFVFWNLWHSVRFVPPAVKLPPLKLVTGLGLGILDFLANAFLAPINSAMDEAYSFLNQSDMRGKFWST